MQYISLKNRTVPLRTITCYVLLHVAVAVVCFAVVPGCSTDRGLVTVWKRKTGYPISSVPVTAGERVYVGSDRLYCLNAETGEIAWEFEGYGIFQKTPLVSGSRLYVLSGGLYCLDAATGTLVWEFWPGIWGDGTPALSGGHVYGIFKDMLFCVDAKTGKKKWQKKVHTSTRPPFIDGGYVYIGGVGKVACLDADDGHLVWKRKMDKVHLEINPVVYNHNVYVATILQREMYCFEGATGKTLWVRRLEKPVFLLSLVYRNMLYLTGSDRVFCVRADSGEEVWSYPFDSPAISPAVMEGSRLYVRTMQGSLACLDAAEGTMQWKTTMPRGKSSMAVEDGRVYIGSQDRYIYCVQRID